jgi:hypothetical protein
MREVVAVLLALSVLAPAGGLAAEDGAQPKKGDTVAMEAASVATTILYTPLKGLLCFVGGGFGGAGAFLSSGERAARTVVNASCKGTWIITPEILKGEKPLELVRDAPCCGYPASP